VFSRKLTKEGWNMSKEWQRKWEIRTIYGQNKYFYDFYTYSYKIDDVVFTKYSASFQEAVDKECMWVKLSE